MHCSCTTRGDTCSFFLYPSMLFPVFTSLAWKALLGRRVSQIYNWCSWAQTLRKSGPSRLDICIAYIEMQFTYHLHLQFWVLSNENVVFKYGIYPCQRGYKTRYIPRRKIVIEWSKEWFLRFRKSTGLSLGIYEGLHTYPILASYLYQI